MKSIKFFTLLLGIFTIFTSLECRPLKTSALKELLKALKIEVGRQSSKDHFDKEIEPSSWFDKDTGSGAAYTEPTIEICFDYDSKVKEAIGNTKLYSYFKSLVDELDSMFVGSGLQVNGQPLHAALGTGFNSVGSVDLNAMGNPSDIEATNVGYWTAAKVANRREANCNVMYLVSMDEGWFGKAKVHGVAKLNVLCSKYAFGLLRLTDTDVFGSSKEVLTRTLAHETGHILGAIHFEENVRITNTYTGAAVAAACTGSCDFDDGSYCLMDTASMALEDQNRYGACSRAQIGAATAHLSDAMINSCLLHL